MSDYRLKEANPIMQCRDKTPLHHLQLLNHPQGYAQRSKACVGFRNVIKKNLVMDSCWNLSRINPTHQTTRYFFVINVSFLHTNELIVSNGGQGKI